jgi:hypothetical protein
LAYIKSQKIFGLLKGILDVFAIFAPPPPKYEMLEMKMTSNGRRPQNIKN